MRLGIGSYTYGWAVGIPGYPPPCPLTHIELLERAAGLGVHVVQIGDNLPLERLSDKEVAALSAHASRLGIDLETGARGIGPAHLCGQLEIAALLRSRILRLVIDTATHRPSPDEAIDTLRALTPLFERAGVCLAIENH